MRYIIQLSTGSFEKSSVKAADVLQKLELCCRHLRPEKLIFGWAPDAELNRMICEFSAEQGMESYLWLPVFAEIQDFTKVRINRKITQDKEKAFNTDGGDRFEFACQSDALTLKRVEEVFDKMTDGCAVNGVFLDRIRYASPAVSGNAIYGCWCPHCQNTYQSCGVATGKILEMAGNRDLGKFIPKERHGMAYRFADQNVDRLMEAKRTVISRQVSQLCGAFRKRGLKIGIDTFAPAIADFVGQDLPALGKQADFVKPMVYLRTNAPAGLPFELKGLGEAVKRKLDQLWGGPVDTITNVVKQVCLLKDMGIGVTPGIDVNKIEGICSADGNYVRTFIEELGKAGCDAVVLSWDVMRISREMTETLESLREL